MHYRKSRDPILLRQGMAELYDRCVCHPFCYAVCLWAG